MEKITVELGANPYEVFVKKGLLADTGWDGGAARITRLAAGGRIAFVSDENVWASGGEAFFEALKARGADTAPFAVILPPGEKTKTLSGLERLAGAFAEAGLTRGGLVCAMGGGVVGDLAGFAAATWMRGVRYVQVPTTLLAMVDSSVGGKTAVDIPAGKNLIGAFYQPSVVLADLDMLASLPGGEFRSGMAEVIKYGAIKSEGLFERLGRMQQAVSADGLSVPSVPEGVIADCIRIKAEIVAGDEFDNGQRMLLNFGHTFGHAIEAKYGFEKYTHGIAVAMGMRIAVSFGEAVGVTEPGTAAHMESLLNQWGLSEKEQPDDLIDWMRKDKKAGSDAVNLVLLRRIGDADIFRMSFADIRSAIETLK